VAERGVVGWFQLPNGCSSSCLAKVTVGFDLAMANSLVLASEGTLCRTVILHPESFQNSWLGTRLCPGHGNLSTLPNIVTGFDDGRS
jgi:hypothetical protein